MHNFSQKADNEHHQQAKESDRKRKGNMFILRGSKMNKSMAKSEAPDITEDMVTPWWHQERGPVDDDVFLLCVEEVITAGSVGGRPN